VAALLAFTAEEMERVGYEEDKSKAPSAVAGASASSLSPEVAVLRSTLLEYMEVEDEDQAKEQKLVMQLAVQCGWTPADLKAINATIKKSHEGVVGQLFSLFG
jgi:hypothetical protein